MWVRNIVLTIKVEGDKFKKASKGDALVGAGGASRGQESEEGTMSESEGADSDACHFVARQIVRIV